MTINIAVLTAEALVLGCDSIASTTKYLLDPFQFDVEPDEHGTTTITFNMSHIFPQVTNAWGGVTKMFEISRSPSVAAVTAGLARLDGQTIASLAAQFFRSRHGAPEDVTVEQVAKDFLAFMRVAYDRYYQGSKLPDALKEGPLFLVGGYATADHFPSLFRINVQENKVVEAYGAGDSGVAWEGQSDSVERLLRGYDMNLRRTIEKAVKDTIAATRETMVQAMADILQQTLDKLETEMPHGVLTELPPAPSISLPWDRFRVGVPYSNLPLQDAVDLAVFFVNIQSGKSKFAHGLATVGGRTHIGIITKHKGSGCLMSQYSSTPTLGSMMPIYNQQRSGELHESPVQPEDLWAQRDQRSGAIKERTPVRTRISAPKSDLRIEVVNGRLEVVRKK